MNEQPNREWDAEFAEEAMRADPGLPPHRRTRFPSPASDRVAREGAELQRRLAAELDDATARMREVCAQPRCSCEVGYEPVEHAIRQQRRWRSSLLEGLRRGAAW